MAKVDLIEPVSGIRGSFRKGGVVNRRKKYRDSKGRVVNESETEAYVVRNPRDWKKHPAQGRELLSQQRFSEASAQVRQILMAAKPDYTPTQQELNTLRYWQERFEAQLRKPEAWAPIDTRTGTRKSYCRLDAYIRTCLMRDMQ